MPTKTVTLDLGPPFTREPASIYHSLENTRKYMSSHQLKDFRKSPLLWRRKHLGLFAVADDGDATVGRANAFAFGTAAHTLILEGPEAFDLEYLVHDGPVNEKTGRPYGTATKKFTEWRAEQELEVIGTDVYRVLDAMSRNVWRHPVAAKLIDLGEPELVLRHEYRGLPCQIMADWLSPAAGLVDLKTCVDLDWFENDCRRFEYVHQFAFYRAVIREATGVELDVHCIAVEKNEPFRCGVWRVPPVALNAAERENVTAIKEFLRCRETDKWPTRYEAVRSLGF